MISSFAFLDINPLVKGTRWSFPSGKWIISLIWMMKIWQQCMFSLKKGGSCHWRKLSLARKVGEAVIGLEVPQARIHLIPMQKESDMLFSNPKLKLSDEEFKAVAEAIRAAF